MTLPNPYSGLIGYVSPGQEWGGTAPLIVDMQNEAAASFPLGVTLPPVAIVTGFAVHIPQTIGADTATNIGIGTEADPDKYALLDLSKTDTEEILSSWDSPLTDSESIVISACDNAGDAVGTIGGGDGDFIIVRLNWYRILPIYAASRED